jgi:hypothetical protein
VKRIFVADTAAEAGLVLDMLAEAGIDAVVEGEAFGGTRVPFDLSTQPSICVREADVERALGLIDEHRKHAAAEPPPVLGDEMPERPSRRLFKQALLAWVIASAIGLVAFAATDLPVLLVLVGVVCVGGIVWLMMRRAGR